MKKLSKLIVLALSAALCFTACQTETSPTPPITPQKTAGSISYATASVSKTANDAAFTNTLTNTGDGTVSYASSKTDVATVNASTGEVTIVGAGTATITATVADSDTYTYATKTASYTLTVTATYTVTLTGGSNATISGGNTTQEGLSDAMETVTFTANDGYYFEDFMDITSNGITATRTSDSVVTVSGTPTGNASITIPDAKQVSASYIGTKKPTEAKAVGDIVFSDGSATPYTSGLTLIDDQKAKAIAVIFYVGTELNSGDDTTTSRTLGVGLAHNKRGLAWCTTSANAYNKNITTIQCPASGNAGALTFTGDKNGSDNLSQIEAFEGVDDTATEANYPAFYFAKNYASQEGSHVSGTDYASDWYLPTIAELFQIWKSKETVDAASKLCGGSEFGTNVYWSSSQYASDDDNAYFLYFYRGDWSYDNKDINGRYVCAVRAFN